MGATIKLTKKATPTDTKSAVKKYSVSGLSRRLRLSVSRPKIMATGQSERKNVLMLSF